MILPIVSYGNAVLKRQATEISADYPDLKELIGNMFETMYSAGGVGLAAPQVNLSLRLFVVDASPFSDEDPDAEGLKKVFINARITWRSDDEVLFNEGCLSFPGLREDIYRPSRIKIRYQDENFEWFEEEYKGIPARVIQHEYDHIEGLLMADHLSNLKKMILKRKLKEISLGMVDVSYKMKFAK